MSGLRTLLHHFLQIKVKILVLITFILILIITAIVLVSFDEDSSCVDNHEVATNLADNGGHPIILWWTPFTGDKGSVRKCASNECFFTNTRAYYTHEDLQTLLFYGSSLSPEDMPQPWPQSKKPRPLWGLLHEESAKNVALLQHSAALSLFNLSATFSRHSHFPLTLQHLSSKQALTGLDYFVSISEKNRLQEKLAPVVFVQSDCDTPSERDSYISELMKYIPVDSYGLCLQNKKLPEYLQNNMEGMHHQDFWKLLAQYKFTIAFENAVCEDYISEKLWRPLILGSVPIYYGSPSVQDWLPNTKSVIKINDFKSPQDLANFILQLNNDDTLYEEFLGHKFGENKITNKNLTLSLDSRTWGTENEDVNTKNFVEEFECFVCTHLRLQQDIKDFKDWTVTGDHYNCPPPVSPLTGVENKNNWWLEQWYQGKAEAQVLQQLISKKKYPITREYFYSKVGECMLAPNQCLID